MGIYRGAGGSGDAVNDASSEALITIQAKDAALAAQAAAEAAQVAAELAETNAETAETNAETAETNAETAATNAASSASAASTSASNAATSATNAANSATAAQTAETNAETAETNAASSASAASTSASNAATSATNASNSASAASTSATNASNSASAAATSATNAANSATAAQTAQTAAELAETNAETAETNAETAATNASNSASAAATSATNASNSASSASTSATNASNSASAAATSATNASNSASAASTSASNAATSESNAATSASNAAASYDSFDDRYLGAKSSAPTLDNDGNALLTGALYFNTTTNEMKVWSGSAWLNAYASLSGALLATNNLSDLNNTATARTNLGVAIGTNVQAWDADLDTWATKTAPSGTVVGTSDSQTLTNKTIALGSNTVSGTLAQFNTAVTDADLASLAGSETLSNKTLAGVTNTGNLTFTGTGNRITGDFSNATIANRVAFQTSTTNGNTVVGIIPNGTATQTQLQLFSSPDYTNYSRLAIQNTGSSINFLSDFAGTNSYLPVTFNLGGSERLRIDTSGVVDIGGTSGGSVGERLVVEGANSAGHRSARINNTSTTNGYSTLWLGSSNDGMLRGGSTASAFTDQLAMLTSGAIPLTFYTNNTERMRIDSSGNVGIGTTSPGSKLSLGTSSVATAGYPTIRTFETGSTTMGIGTSSSSLDICSNDAGYRISFYAGSQTPTERMRIDSSGNVGIGTSSPTAPLTVVAPSNGLAFAINGRSSDNLGGLYFYANNGTTSHCQITASASEYRVAAQSTAVQTFYTNGSERMRITSGGDLQFNSGYGSVATAYGCRAWVNFNGTGTVAIRGSGNVSSITDNGTGDYTVNFTNAMPDINYCSQGFSWSSGKNASPIILGAKASTSAPHTTSSVRVTIHDNFSESTLYDSDYVCVAVFR